MDFNLTDSPVALASSINQGRLFVYNKRYIAMRLDDEHIKHNDFVHKGKDHIYAVVLGVVGKHQDHDFLPGKILSIPNTEDVFPAATVSTDIRIL
jgi:hypothetical protein